jgi:hypothetical protein
MNLHRLIVVSLLLIGPLALPKPTHAAQSYDNCAGFIDALPATISTQGVWCLKEDLSTNITSGNAITIATNNVTIDCNDFKIGGLAAGNASLAYGIFADGRQNTTIRHCNIRGFYEGIVLQEGAGHLVEDNRLDNNLETGLSVYGDNVRVRRNAVYDTGGSAGGTLAAGIFASGNIVDNIVSGVFADKPGGYLYGIRSSGFGAQVLGNSVSGIAQTATQGGAIASSAGITLENWYQRASGNQVVGSGTNNIGIASGLHSYCLDNTVGGFVNAFSGTCTGDRNFSPP